MIVNREFCSMSPRLCHSAHRGATLVELAISVMILVIVTIAWLKIIGIQSARKEARRREAVEWLAGTMDAFMYYYMKDGAMLDNYQVRTNSSTISFIKQDSRDVVEHVFDPDVSPIGYQLCVVKKEDLRNADLFTGWKDIRKPRDEDEGTTHYWFVGRLFEKNGSLAKVGEPFFTLPIYLGANVKKDGP